MPEDAQAPLVLTKRASGSQGIVDAQELVIFRNQLDQRTARVAEEREILHDIQQATFLTGAANHGLQRDNALLTFAIDFLPLEEMLPACRNAADLALIAVR